MEHIEWLKEDSIEQLKQELISKIEQLQSEYPQLAWLQDAVDMQKPNDLGVTSDGEAYASPFIVTDIGKTHSGRFN